MTDTPIDGPEPTDDETFRVADRRHWARDDDAGDSATDDDAETPEVRQPTVLDEYRLRAEQAALVTLPAD